MTIFLNPGIPDAGFATGRAPLSLATRPAHWSSRSAPPPFGECWCLAIDSRLSDESHAQHEDSSHQDLDEEHRIGGLGIDSEMVLVTSGSRKC